MGRRRLWLLVPLLPTALLIAAIALSRAAGSAAARLEGTTGLVQTLYGTGTFSGPPVVQRATSAIDLSLFDERPDLSARFVSITWSGVWLVPASGPVDIYAGADDLVRVLIDDRLVIERNQRTGFETQAASVALEAGPHRLRIEFAQFGGTCTLDVRWAPAGGRPRRFEPESLLVSEPDARLIARARTAARLRFAARAVSYAFACVAVFLVMFAASVWGLRWYRTGVPRLAVSRGRAALVRWGDRYGPAAARLTAVAVVGWVAVRWASGLNPETLWSDDVAVACLAKFDSMWMALSMKTPLPPVFVGLLWTTRRVVPDAEVSLQLWPYVFGLAGPVLVGLAVAKLTASRFLGIAAAALGYGTTNLAQYAIFVHPYSLDYAVTSLLLVLGVWLLVDRRVGLPAVAAAGLVGALFSVPAVIVSIALVHTGALAGESRESGRPSSRWRRWGTAIGFDVLLGTLYLLFYRSRTSQELQGFWLDGFAPTSSLADLGRFLAAAGWTAVQDALPGPLAWLAPCAALGLVALAWTARHRWFALFIVTCFVGVLAASILRVYPIGTGYKGRVTLFAYPLVPMLVAVGIGALTRWLPARRLVQAAAAIAVAIVMSRIPPPVYPPLDLSRIARALEATAGPADAIVLNTAAAGLVGYYTSWPVTARADRAPYRFVIVRPLTLTIPRSSEEGGPGLEVLDRFLAEVRPSRLFFMSTRRKTQHAERAIQANGFYEARRMTSRISTQLIEYRRAGS